MIAIIIRIINPHVLMWCLPTYVVVLLQAVYLFVGGRALASSSTVSAKRSGAEGEDTCYVPSLTLPRHLQEFYIGGQWVAPRATMTPLTLDVINPSFNKSFATIALGCQDDTDAAVRAAREALSSSPTSPTDTSFSTWSDASYLPQRIALVEKLLIIYNRREEEMAQLISAEMGAPIDQAREAQVGSGSYHIDQFLHAITNDHFELEHLVPGAHPHSATTINNVPIGVVALITPWNWPMNQVTLKVIPALLVGCTVVLKPSEMTPLSALLFAEMIDEAGFPPGVFNLVNGDGVGVGTQLSSHPDVDMVSFTGSSRAGRLISQAAASSNLKKVSLELGGKGANLIFADIAAGDGSSDDDDEEDNLLYNVIQDGVWNCFGNSGQSCNAPTRMLVERSIYSRASAIATEVATAEDMVVQAAHLEGDFYGPVASQVQYDRIQRYIQIGIEEDARILVGGPGKPKGVTTDGFFVQPTIFVDCQPDMTIMQEEIFGPVLCMMPFDTEEEAVAIANGTPYGLTNYVWTNSRDRRRRLARSLQSGMVEMNGVGADDGAPFAAMKASGNGREGGVWGLEEFCVVKVVSGVE